MIREMQVKGKSSQKKLPLIQSDDSPMKVVQKEGLDVKYLIQNKQYKGLEGG